MSAKQEAKPNQYVKTNCQCGSGGGQYLNHYEIVECSARGRMHWALRPVRSGPLVSFPWPGNWRMQPRQQNQPR